MSARAVIGIMIFLAFIVFFTSQLATVKPGGTGIFNVTTNNQTEFVSTGTQDFGSFSGNICELSGSENSFIDAIQAFINNIPVVNCVTGFSTFLFSYQSIKTGVVWLGFIILAMVAALIYIALGLVRGGK